jgi:hypothetical protein
MKGVDTLKCQWPSVSPHWRPRNSPLVAIISPRWWPSEVPTGGHRISPPGGLLVWPAVRIGLDCGLVTNGHVIDTASLDGHAILGKLEALIHANPAGPGTTQRQGGAGEATIAGNITLCGGPNGGCFVANFGGCAPPNGCSRADRVVAINTRGVIVAEEYLPLKRKPRFRLRVTPGQYAIELLSDGARVHDALLQTRGATAHIGQPAKVIFVLNIP